MTAPISAATNALGSPLDRVMARLDQGASKSSRSPDAKQLEARDQFRDFVGGTFFKTMLKSLRSMQKPPKYFYGGQAEKIFQQQLDEQLTDDMARQYGDQIAGPLYDVYAAQRGLPTESHARSSAAARTGGTHVFDAFA
jgi:Rod binding domain-containing protein